MDFESIMSAIPSPRRVPKDKRGPGPRTASGPILLGPMDIQRSLAEIGDRLTRAKNDLRIIEEQIVFQNDVVDDLKTRMLVSETPLADREYRIARDDLDRMVRSRDETTAEIAELHREQDRLLDRMLDSKV